MRIIEGTEFNLEYDCAVAIGKFDGFHIGHRKLLAEVNKFKEKGLKTAIFTFHPSPASLFSNEPIKELTTREEKRKIFEDAKVDVLVEYPFNKESASMLPEDFVRKILVEKMHAKYVVAGSDISFGAKGIGDYKLLQKMSKEFDFSVCIIDKVSLEGHEISSTYVREIIRQGNMKMATLLLDAPFHISGVISHGNQLGRTIGMPTANIYPDEGKLLPPFGVYFSKAVVEGKEYKSITNIGKKPTVNQTEQVGVETFLYDFSGDIYGKNMSVFLLDFKRSECKFENVDALINQMQKDIEEGRKYSE